MDISEVFTPRSHIVNNKIYVPRLDIERKLLRSINGSLHTLLSGDSGNGKSWLYKKVFDENNISYKSANAANASRLGSLTETICNALIPVDFSQKTGYSETKEAKVKAVVLDGGLSHQGSYRINLRESLELAFSEARRNSGNKKFVLVVDNLESIFDDSKLMKELADIIILLDDDKYASYFIKLLIVGTPNGTLDFFAKTLNLESVANRIEELPRVNGLNLPMVRTIVEKGFNELLRFSIKNTDLSEISNHVFDITIGVAQRVQEYCEKLAYLIEDNSRDYEAQMLRDADMQWLSAGLRHAYSVIESHLNSKKTDISRRNQVIYCIGHLGGHQVNSTILSEEIRREFPKTSTDGNMGIAGVLTELSSGNSPLLKKNPKTKDYRVADPRYLMCIRVMLDIDYDSGKIERRLFKN